VGIFGWLFGASKPKGHLERIDAIRDPREREAARREDQKSDQLLRAYSEQGQRQQFEKARLDARRADGCNTYIPTKDDVRTCS